MNVDTEKPVAGGNAGNADEHAKIKINVEHLASLKKVDVDARRTTTVQEVWDQAVSLLGEPKRDNDRLQTDKGVDLTTLVAETLESLESARGVKSRKWQIVGGTGGAR